MRCCFPIQAPLELISKVKCDPVESNTDKRANKSSLPFCCSFSEMKESKQTPAEVINYNRCEQHEEEFYKQATVKNESWREDECHKHPPPPQTLGTIHCHLGDSVNAATSTAGPKLDKIPTTHVCVGEMECKMTKNTKWIQCSRFQAGNIRQNSDCLLKGKINSWKEMKRLFDFTKGKPLLIEGKTNYSYVCGLFQTKISICVGMFLQKQRLCQVSAKFETLTHAIKIIFGSYSTVTKHQSYN